MRESHIEVAVSRRRLLLAAAFQRHRIVQVALVAVILSFLVTTVPGVRAYQGYSWWMDGILQNLAYGAAAALCLVRTPTASPDRTGWLFLALGLLSFGLSNTVYVWFARALDPVAVPKLCHLVWGTAYVCVAIALVLLVRSRVNRVPMSLWLDGMVVGLGAATVVAVVRVPELVPVLGAVLPRPRSIWPTWWRTCCCSLWSLVRCHCFGGGRRRHCGGLPAACWCLGSSIAPT